MNTLLQTCQAKNSNRWILLAIALISFFCMVLPGIAATNDRPNVLVIVADDLGWADVGYHNPEMRTPHIDQLVEMGAKLECHYVMPVCTPTRVALLSGRYPSRFGNHCTQPTNSQAMPFSTPTLASVLRDVGYDTAIIGKWHLGSLPKWGPNHFGFNYSYGSLAGVMGPYDHRYRLTNPEYTQTFHRNHKFIKEPGHITDLTAAEAVRWIKRPRENPFFLYVPFHAVHVPMVEVPKWLAQNEHIASADRRLYAAATTHMDDAIGQMISALDDTQQRSNTLIIFLSDNGAMLNYRGDVYPPPDPPLRNFSSNAPWRGKKAQLYEGGIRVPAIAVWPDHLQPRTINTPLHVVDWLPTVANLTGASAGIHDKLDGQNIWPILTGTEANPRQRTLYWVSEEDREWLALRSGNWKIVRQGEQPWQLFDLENDPTESTDLAGKESEKLNELLAGYQRERAKDKLPGER